MSERLPPRQASALFADGNCAIPRSATPNPVVHEVQLSQSATDSDAAQVNVCLSVFAEPHPGIPTLSINSTMMLLLLLLSTL